ncbi:MAG: phosphodiester glycosidase family protein [Armatimonadia bacterium]
MTKHRSLLHLALFTMLCLGIFIAPTSHRTPPAVPDQDAPTTGAAEASLVLPIPFQNTCKTRSCHVSRTWKLIGGVGVNAVYINTRPTSVRFLTGFAAGADPVHGYFPRENFYRTVRRYAPRVAINGTYFHMLNGQPTGAIVRHGEFLYDGRWGTTICIDKRGRVTFRYQSGTYGRHRGWKGVENAITTGPTLVRKGSLWLRPRHEGFKDPRVLGQARRSALGLTWDDKLVLVTVHTKISLNKLSHIMLRLGCTEAAALDGGSSTALYCNGEFISKPSRRLSNVLLVYD